MEENKAGAYLKASEGEMEAEIFSCVYSEGGENF